MPSPSQGGASPDGQSSVIDSLFEPGLGNNVMLRRLMHGSFIGLFLVLGALLFLSRGNPHVLALLVIAAGLYASVLWFLKELSALPPSARQIQQMPTDAQAQPEGETEDSLLDEKAPGGPSKLKSQ